MKIDYISDLHLDFHEYNVNSLKKWEKRTKDFVKSLIKEEKGEVLVIAGDISHYNIQSKWAIEQFSQEYEFVIFILGNHDYYLVSKTQEKKYGNSLNRVVELKNLVKDIPNAKLLNMFEVFDYNGVKFCGSTNWYSLQEEGECKMFNEESNDSRLIKKFDIYCESAHERFTEENLKDLEVDVLITHVPCRIINTHLEFGNTYCYYNEINNIKAKNIIFGHCHEQNIYKYPNSTVYINALGYDNEWIEHMDIMDYSKELRNEFKNKWNKIKSFTI